MWHIYWMKNVSIFPTFLLKNNISNISNKFLLKNKLKLFLTNK